MTIKKNIVVVQERYTARDGQERKKYLTIGELHEGQNGEYIVLYSHINLAAIPRKDGDSRVMASLYDPKPRDGDRPQRPERGRPVQDAPDGMPEDDIPFN